MSKTEQFFLNIFGWAKKVLDIGSGAGLLGITLATLGAHVLVTDIESVLPLLSANVRANTFPKLHKIYVRELDWYKDVPEEVRRVEWDFVTATDVIYNPQHYPALYRTLDAVCTPNNTFLLGHQKRDHTLQFFEMLKQDYSFDHVQPELFESEIFNPSVECVQLFHFKKNLCWPAENQILYWLTTRDATMNS
jgi:predicted nicotinamide N-methyase